ncbi:MAG: hypothetical protein H7X92_11915 [Chitinophagales bacterium]|nr:hypothetical protein [Hyphomicrobiales bacterium]
MTMKPYLAVLLALTIQVSAASGFWAPRKAPYSPICSTFTNFEKWGLQQGFIVRLPVCNNRGNKEFPWFDARACFQYKDLYGTPIFNYDYNLKAGNEKRLTITLVDSQQIYEVDADRVSFGQMCLVDNYGPNPITMSFVSSTKKYGLSFYFGRDLGQKSPYSVFSVSTSDWVCEPH